MPLPKMVTMEMAFKRLSAAPISFSPRTTTSKEMLPSFRRRSSARQLSAKQLAIETRRY
jgi:hypothetical protein